MFKYSVNKEVPSPEDLATAQLGVNLTTGEIWTNAPGDTPFRLGGLYGLASQQRPTIRSPGGGFSHINDGKDGTSLPTSDPELDGAFWNDNGVLKVSDG